jgi:type II secretory pathway predicted ATPase ExeA
MSNNRRKAQLARTTPPYDPAYPPEGARLVFGSVAARLQVTVTQLAQAAQISRTAISHLISNRWPVKTDHDALRLAIAALLEERGATPAELATLWHAQLKQGYSPAAVASAAATPELQARPRPLANKPRLADSGKAQPTDQPTEDEDMLPLKAVLSPQARRHFALFTDPFGAPVTRDEMFFTGAEVAYVREAAWQCAQTGGFVAVVGESGAGKSTMLDDLQARLEAETRHTVIIKPSVVDMEARDRRTRIRSADILHGIITRLDEQATVAQTVQARTLQAKRLLQAGVQMGTSHLLVVEEAHSMPDSALTHLKRLHEVRDGRRPLMGILLLGQPELKRRLTDGLRDGTLREVAQRCEVVELLPLDGELKPYLATRAKAAGAELGKLIDDSGMEELRTRLTRKTERGTVSMCYPLAVGNLITRALNKAAELGVPVVNRDVVRAA